MDEIWKDIKGYEGYYQVSSAGTIKSVSRMINNKYFTGKIIKQSKYSTDYLRVHLYKYNKCKWFSVHRLVAEAFIDNPNNLPQVNHIDGNKENNRVDNLEWCTASENIIHSYQILHRKNARAKKINQYDLDNNLIRTYESACQIQKILNFSPSYIIQCCKGNKKNCLWLYLEICRGGK